MLLITPKVEEIIPKNCTLESVFKHIEIVGRTCYNSGDKITQDSAQKFVQNLVQKGHGAMLEHGTIYLLIEVAARGDYDNERAQFYITNPYSFVNQVNKSRGAVSFYITTNYRVIVENGREDDIKHYAINPQPEHTKRRTLKITCDRGVSHELVRHRVFSFAQQSTRYCNFSKSKYGHEITFVRPPWYQAAAALEGGALTPDQSTELQRFALWRDACFTAEHTYFRLLELGETPQQARSVLPNSLATELVMTGTEDQWREFLKLREDKAAHPQAREVAALIKGVLGWGNNA